MRASATAARRRRSLRAGSLVGVHPRAQRDRSERGASFCIAFETVDGFVCVRRLDPLPRPIGGAAPTQQNVCRSVVCRVQWDAAESHAGSSRRYGSLAAPARRLTVQHVESRRSSAADGPSDAAAVIAGSCVALRTVVPVPADK